MNNNKQFLSDMGKRISKRRKELNLTQEQLAEKTNLSLQSISCIELGKKAIRPDNLVKLCKTLNISSDYILMGILPKTQLDKINTSLSTLNESDIIIVKTLINRLSNKPDTP